MPNTLKFTWFLENYFTKSYSENSYVNFPLSVSWVSIKYNYSSKRSFQVIAEIWRHLRFYGPWNQCGINSPLLALSLCQEQEEPVFKNFNSSYFKKAFQSLKNSINRVCGVHCLMLLEICIFAIHWNAIISVEPYFFSHDLREI